MLFHALLIFRWFSHRLSLAVRPRLREGGERRRMSTSFFGLTRRIYFLPADDDAAKRLAEMLTARGIRATFKVVGEKARTLERRGRKDVIAALRKHAIGYHANLHSVHPTPNEDLAECGWLDGVAEFRRREGGGAAEEADFFRADIGLLRPAGIILGAAGYRGLKGYRRGSTGVPCYVDEGTHVGLDQKPFWYAGGLNVYHMGKTIPAWNYTIPQRWNRPKRTSRTWSRVKSRGGRRHDQYFLPPVRMGPS